MGNVPNVRKVKAENRELENRELRKIAELKHQTETTARREGEGPTHPRRD